MFSGDIKAPEEKKSLQLLSTGRNKVCPERTAAAAKQHKKREAGKTLQGYPWKAFLRMQTSEFNIIKKSPMLLTVFFMSLNSSSEKARP